MVLVGQSGGSFIANSHTQQEEVKQAVYEEEAKEEEDAEEEDEEDDMEFTCLKKLSAGERLQLKNATNTAATRSKVLGILKEASVVIQVYSVPAMKLDGLYFKAADKFLLIREEEEPREGMQVVADGLKVLQREME